jgi:RNA polymerase sigma-70 factor (ECF subfamily)
MDQTRDSDDAALACAVQAAQRGDEAGFTYAYRTVQPGLLRFLTVLVGGDAEDVASETWAHVCRDLAGFRGDGDGFRGWVATIGRHRAIDHLRARKRRGTDPLPVEALLGEAAVDDTAGEVFEAAGTRTALALIRSLPREQAEAVLLRVVVGLDAKSTARVLGKRPGAVRTSAYRGVRRLAATLDDEVGAEPEPRTTPGVTRRGLTTLT